MSRWFKELLNSGPYNTYQGLIKVKDDAVDALKPLEHAMLTEFLGKNPNPGWRR